MCDILLLHGCSNESMKWRISFIYPIYGQAALHILDFLLAAKRTTELGFQCLNFECWSNGMKAFKSSDERLSELAMNDERLLMTK